MHYRSESVGAGGWFEASAAVLQESRFLFAEAAVAAEKFGGKNKFHNYFRKEKGSN